MAPIILIPAQSSDGKEENGKCSACRQSYIESIHKAGGLPIILPLGLSENEWKQAYDLADGILLSGGSDIAPSAYNQKPHPKLGETLEERDLLEVWITKQAYIDNKPLLGICRGIQMINVALGGTLFQDLEDQFESKINHRTQGTERWTTLAHQLKIHKDSRLFSIIKREVIEINSLHHQAICKLALGLKISAESNDSLVEAIEAPDKKFFLGIQGHPEVLWQEKDKSWLSLFQALIEACKKD